jgi:Holliday junction resolvasome RuvABC endonuclease subunit
LISLGFDPGLATLAFGVLDLQPSSTRVLDRGDIGEPDAELSHAERLNRICLRVDGILNQWCPDALTFEAQAGVHVGRDRAGQPTHISLRYVHAVTGILRMAANTALAEPIPCYEPQPSTIKVTLLGRGHGHASKDEVKAGVARLLGVKRCSSHVADALAASVCGARLHRVERQKPAYQAAAAASLIRNT